MLALALACLLAIPHEPRRSVRLGFTLGAVGTWAIVVACGLWMVWYHRPIERLKTVVPGKIYLSAIPTPDGLDVAQPRHHFKTIINVFNEDTPERSPLLPAELAWLKAHGVRYLGSPSDPLESDAFLDQTLALAQDPDAWPILLHCHGCMDRSPAWMGIYRFVVEGRPLDEILREIEAHRGLRPKASVTLLYNRVLEPRAPARYANDPTAALLKESARGCEDPYYREIAEAQARRTAQRRTQGDRPVSDETRK
jgi:hypothetical protein